MDHQPDPAAAIEHMRDMKPEEFLAKFQPKGPWCLTAIGVDKKKIETKTFYPKTLEAMVAWIDERNGVHNLYFSVNLVMKALTKQDKRTDIKEVIAFPPDLDPRDAEAKRLPFAQAAPGAVGFECMLPLALELVHNHDIPLKTILRAMTSRPAEILGIDAGTLAVDAAADVILIHRARPWPLDAD